MAAERRFRVMGSDAHLIVVGPGAAADALVERAVARLHQLEQRWSRFRSDSEISRLNVEAGRAVTVSADTVGLVERATDAWRLSGGAFDPTVLGPMIRAGYDRSFEHLGAQVESGRSLLGIGAADIVVDGFEVTLPAGTGFDPGGIGKGLAADLVVDELLAEGADGACVNLGGDVRVAGAAPGDQPWTVGVWHPEWDEPLARVGLVDGAVATSTTRLRHWIADGQPRHHLIDPRSGQPSDTDLELATVVAADAWVAEVLTKAVILRGSRHPFDVVDATAAQALAVDRLGRVQSTPGLAAYLGPTALPDHLDLAGFAAPTVAAPAAPGMGRAS